MDDLTDQIRAWTDHVTDRRDVKPVTPDEVLDGTRNLPSPLPAGSPGGRVAGGRHTWAAVAAVAVLLVGGAVGLVVIDRDDTTAVISGDSGAEVDPTTASEPTTTTAPGGEVTFNVLDVRQGGGTLRSATAPEPFADAWAASGTTVNPPPVDPPPVDFDRQAVVFMTIDDDACPPTLERFQRAEGTLTPMFIEPDTICITPAFQRTFVVAVDWASTGPSFRLFVPGQPVYGSPDQTIVVTRPGAEALPTDPVPDPTGVPLSTTSQPDPSAPSATARGAACAAADPDAGVIALGAHILELVDRPEGYEVDGTVEHTDTGPGGTVTDSVTMVNEAGATIEVTSFSTELRIDFVRRAQDGAPAKQELLAPCAQPGVPLPVELSSGARIVVGKQQWEYGGFLVVGDAGATEEAVLTAAAALASPGIIAE